MFVSISINNKLQQPQAAHGVLVYAMKNHGADVVSNISNTRESVSSHFQTPRRELETRRVAEYLLTSFEV